jgi:hypothetical protein
MAMGAMEEVIVPCEKIDVQCYSGYKANERPIAFTYQKQRREVVEIVDRWYEGGLEAGNPDVSYFKVRTIEGEIFLLRYVSLFDAWSIVTPSRPSSPSLPPWALSCFYIRTARNGRQCPSISPCFYSML